MPATTQDRPHEKYSPACLTQLLRRSVDPRLFFDGGGTFFVFLFAAAFLFCCNITTTLGERLIAIKHHGGLLFLLFSFVLFAQKNTATNLKSFLTNTRARVMDLLSLVAFWILMGGHRLASHGVAFAGMASDFWHVSALSPLARRITVPGFAHILGIGQGGYIVFWHLLLFACFVLANHFLKQRKLGGLERFSILTSSLMAFSFIGAGYSEIFVLLAGLYALTCRTSFIEKTVLVALMFGAHEVATVVILLPLVLESQDRERTEWTTLLVTLTGVYALSYAFNWGFHVGDAMELAVKPDPGQDVSSLALFLAHPWLSLVAVLVAYKLYWIAVFANFFHTDARQKLLTLGVLVTVPLILIACDASRLVQFSTLALFLVVAHQMPRWSMKSRKALALANLTIPSFYVGTNCLPLMGAGGLYAWELKIGLLFGQDWSALFRF